jgi:hypothetical protein
MAVTAQARQVEDDLRTIVGGNFSPDALGDEYTRILQRLSAAPAAYLDAFERRFLAPSVDPRTLSHLYLPSFLERVASAAPERVRALSQRLLGRYDSALSIADHAAEQDFSLTEALGSGETSRFVQRLQERRRTLRAILGQPPGRS